MTGPTRTCCAHMVPVGGAARVLITSNGQSVANLGTRVGVEVFTRDEALAFLADRTGRAQ